MSAPAQCTKHKLLDTNGETPGKASVAQHSVVSYEAEAQLVSPAVLVQRKSEQSCTTMYIFNFYKKITKEMNCSRTVTIK